MKHDPASSPPRSAPTAASASGAGSRSGARPHRYQQIPCGMTLREGLEEYRSANADVILDPEALGERARELFACHDAVHVVFGTNTDLGQEALTDVVTVAGTDVGLRAYMAYLSAPEATQVLGDIGISRAVWGSLRVLPHLFRGWRAARRAREKWPFYEWERHLDTPLDELRERFGIPVLDLPPPMDT